MTAGPDAERSGSVDRCRHATAGLTALMMALGLLAFLWFASRAGRGLDLTDEAYYLFLAHEPGQFPVTVTLAGHVYHPIDILVGGQIRYLRLANLAITYGLAVLATLVVLRAVAPRQGSRGGRLAVATGFGSVSLALFAGDSGTPSYNSLDAQAVLLVVLGVVLSRTKGTGARVAARLGYGVLIGLGGALLFLAKPPAAAGVGVITLAALLARKPRSWAAVAAASASSVLILLVFAFSVDGSPGRFVRRLSTAIGDVQTIDAGHDWHHIFSVPTPNTSIAGWVMFVALVIATVSGTQGLVSRRMWPWAPLTCLAIAVSASVPVNRPSILMQVSVDQATTFLFLVPAAAAVVLTLRSTHRHAAPVALPLFLLVIPCAAAFGTSNNLWLIATLAPAPWVLAAVARMSPLTKKHGIRVLAPMVATTLLSFAAMLGVNGAHPYRQSQPIWAAGTKTVVGPGGTLELPDALSRTIKQLRASADTSGFPPGTGVLDLTGEAPGLVYALGASAPTGPWISGGYPGSEALVRRTIGRSDCSALAHSWLLRAPTEDRSLPTTVLSAYGASFPDDFERVARISATGATPELNGPVELWRPRRAASKAIAACHRAQERVTTTGTEPIEPRR